MADLLNTVAPEFDADALRDDFLVIAASLISASCFGVQTGLATAFLAAHMLAQVRRSDPSATGGAVSSVKEGDVQIGFRAPIEKYATAGDAELGETKYGRQYLRIRGSRACGHATVIVPS